MENNNKWCVADFETTTYEYYQRNGITKVWLYAISNPDGEIMNWGENINEFFDFIKKNLNGYTIYFHNLKFDGSFLLNYFINRKLPYKEKIHYSDAGCYNTLISEEGQFYQITYHAHRGCTIKFLDSLKIIPFKVEKIAKDFKLPMLKGHIDYNNYTVNETTLSYVFNDVKIVALALKELKSLGLTQMTTASCAYNNFKNSFKFMDEYFPELETDFLENYRLAYRGGRCQVNPIYEGQILYNVKRYDVNSMYPSVMVNCELPFGNPIRCEVPGRYKFELYKVDIKFKLKEGHLPSLLKKNTMWAEGSYYIESDGLETMYISSVDLEILTRHYDIESLIYLEIFGFRTVKGIFKEYIDYWYKVKSTTQGAMKAIAKLMLNALYGKFGSRCRGKSKIPYLDEEGILNFATTPETDMKKYYLPMAIAIVSYAHLIIDDAIVSTGYENFVYCDTDSVHTLSSLDRSIVDNVVLGKFKLEATELKSKYIRQKTYCFCEMNKDNEIEYTITCAGMNDATKQYLLDSEKENVFNVFDKGLTIEGYKLLPMQVPGGTVLVPSTFTLQG